MIDEIRVQNLALIKDASIQPSTGLTVLTGETGAGKTALLESCKLLMGMRADKNLVREGAKQSFLQGRFFFAQKDINQESLFAPSDGEDVEIVVQRSLSEDGRSRVQIDGNMANVTQLYDLVAPHIDLCSQHDSTKLLKPQTHIALLDIWAQDSLLVDAYSQALEASDFAAQDLMRVREAATLSGAQLDQARFVLSQIDVVDPQVGEYEQLVEQLKRAENSEALARTVNTTYELLSGEGGALDQLNSAITSIDEGGRLDATLEQHAQSLRDAGYILEDVSRDILTYRDGVDFDIDTLTSMQERVAAYQGLMRNYGPTVEDVIGKAEEARRTIASVDNAEYAEKQALAAFEQAEVVLASAAHELSSARKQAATKFAREITSIMSQLEMGSAELFCNVVDLPRSEWMKSGPNNVELLFAPATNMSPRPLARIASGGELSRVMLALHVVMGKQDAIETLVLDEIDAGVGGTTAVALADVIKRLAETHQVIVVTHLPQVACVAEKHYIVKKLEVEGVAETSIEEAINDSRVKEIARMLAGNVTEASLKHAEEMLSR